MRRALALLAAWTLLAAATPAAAQASSEAQRPQQPPAEPATLDLRLDDAARFARPPSRFAPQEKDADGLPSLGENARPMPKSTPSSSRLPPYPPDSNPGR